MSARNWTRKSKAKPEKHTLVPVICEFKPPKNKKTIQINTNFYLTLETPKIKDLLKLNSLDKEQLVKACVKKVTFNGEVFYVNKFVNEEIKEMMDNLPLNVLSKFEDFLSKQPELTVVIKTDTEEKEVSGLLTFFTFR